MIDCSVAYGRGEGGKGVLKEYLQTWIQSGDDQGCFLFFVKGGARGLAVTART